MAVTLVATAGSASANSYATRAEAGTYLEARLNASAWLGATESDQIAALIEATREMEVMAWIGDRVSTTQALAWPRSDAEDPDAEYGTYLSESVIPNRIKNATIELALEFLRAGTTDVAGHDPSLEVTSKTVDVLTTTYRQSRTTGLARFPRVTKLIGPLLASTGKDVVRS